MSPIANCSRKNKLPSRVAFIYERSDAELLARSLGSADRRFKSGPATKKSLPSITSANPATIRIDNPEPRKPQNFGNLPNHIPTSRESLSPDRFPYFPTSTQMLKAALDVQLPTPELQIRFAGLRFASNRVAPMC
jgi:hypothetical protein